MGLTSESVAPQRKLPNFSAEQVKALKDMFPIRLLEPEEDVDAYRHYCGAAALVQLIEAHCPQQTTVSPGQVGDTEEDLDIEAVQRAINEHNGKT